VISHILDTDICIFALKKRNHVLLEKMTAHDGRMAISDVTLFELYYGAEKYDDPQSRIGLIEEFTARLEVLPFDSRAARHTGQIRAKLERKGLMIGSYDLMIAGIARSQGLVLVNNNVREFSRVESLLLEKWV
jgi:tRNA(fMet)-specific endonuclease VapC